MALKNKWVGYLDRTYQQIKDSVLTKFGAEIPEMTDHTESNPYVKFLSIWGGIAEQMNYYIDNGAREVFLPVARLYESGVKTANIFDYRVRGVKASSVDLTFYLSEESLDDILLPLGTQVSTEDGIIFTTTRQEVIYSGELSIIVPAVQMEIFTAQVIGTSDGTKSQKFAITEDTEDGSISITVGGVSYQFQDTLAFSAPTDNVFSVSLNTEGILEVIFGNGYQGSIPPNGSDIVAEYGISKGTAGNLAENTITTLVSNIPVNGTILSVTNYNRASGGADIQSLEDLKKVIPLSIRTLRRAVSESDYEDIAKMVSGVYGAKVVYTCGNFVDVYVVPEGGGVASELLLVDVKAAYYPKTKMITTEVRALAAGEVKLLLEVDVKVLPAFSMMTTELNMRNTLKNYVNVENGIIGGSTEVGNLYEVMEAVTGVEVTKIKKISIVPFARITAGDHVLNWTKNLKVGSTGVVVWSLRYSSAGDFELLRNGQYAGTKLIGELISLEEIEFTLLAGDYISGDSWQFVTYPYNDSINLSEPSVLVLDDSNLILNMSGGV